MIFEKRRKRKDKKAPQFGAYLPFAVLAALREKFAQPVKKKRSVIQWSIAEHFLESGA